MTSRSVSVRVPATIGNFAGPGSCGAVALEASLNVKVSLRPDPHVAIRYFGEDGERVPRDRTNLVVRALELATDGRKSPFCGADLEIYSSVPVGAGFGSSSAAILAGLMAADRLFSLGLDEKSMVDLAAAYEPRKENILAAWHGGFAACTESHSAAHQYTPLPEGFVLHAVIPAVRGRNVPGLEEALNVELPGNPAIFVCGGGPAVGILAEDDPCEAVSAVRQAFARHGVAATASEYRSSNTGARHWNVPQPRVRAAGVAEHAYKPTLIPV